MANEMTIQMSAEIAADRRALEAIVAGVYLVGADSPEADTQNRDLPQRAIRSR